MTSYDTPSPFKVSADYEYTTCYAWKPFSNITQPGTSIGSNDCWLGKGDTSYVMIELDKPYNIQKFIFRERNYPSTTYNRAPSSIAVYMGNSIDSLQLIETINTPGWGKYGTIHEYNISNNTPYKIIKFVCKSIDSDKYVGFAHCDMYYLEGKSIVSLGNNKYVSLLESNYNTDTHNFNILIFDKITKEIMDTYGTDVGLVSNNIIQIEGEDVNVIEKLNKLTKAYTIITNR